MKSIGFHGMTIRSLKVGVRAYNPDNDNIVAWSGKCWYIIGSLKKFSTYNRPDLNKNRRMK